MTLVLCPAGPVRLRDVHDDVAEAEEDLVGQDLSEEVRDVVGGRDVGDGDALVLDELADEEVAPHDVLGAAVVLWVVCEIDRRLVVHVDGRRAGRGKSELLKELPVVGR